MHMYDLCCLVKSLSQNVLLFLKIITTLHYLTPHIINHFTVIFLFILLFPVICLILKNEVLISWRTSVKNGPSNYFSFTFNFCLYISPNNFYKYYSSMHFLMAILIIKYPQFLNIQMRYPSLRYLLLNPISCV